jgi:hypothetical protein
MSTELTADTLTQATKALTGKGPVQMVNLLRYFQDAHYPAGSNFPRVSTRTPFLAAVPHCELARARPLGLRIAGQIRALQAYAGAARPLRVPRCLRRSEMEEAQR